MSFLSRLAIAIAVLSALALIGILVFYFQDRYPTLIDALRPFRFAHGIHPGRRGDFRKRRPTPKQLTNRLSFRPADSQTSSAN